MLIKDSLPLNTGFSGGDAFTVTAQTERIDVQIVIQKTKCSGADTEILVVIDDVLINPFVVRAPERPTCQLPVS